MSDVIIQATGYLASVLLAFSLLVTTDLRFRWLNTGGCLSFIGYGILIDAFPIILTNATLLFINVVALVKLYRKREHFDLLEFGAEAPLIDKFLRFYAADIEGYFPAFRMQEDNNQLQFVVLRDMVLANVFVATVLPDGTGVVRINYTVPKYRDFKVGRFIFEKERDYLLSRGVKKLVYEEVFNKSHLAFLKKMGFESIFFEGRKCWVKLL